MNFLQKYNERLKGPSRTRILVSIGLAVVVLISFFGGFFAHAAIRGKNVQVVSEVVEIMDKVGFVYDPELDEYVKLEGDKVAQLIAGNFLDGYSGYYTKEEYEKILEENSGKYVSIGISFKNVTDKDSNEVLKVLVNSPAFHAGIRVGDKIVQARIVDQQEPSEFSNIQNGKQLADFLKDLSESDRIEVVVQRGEEILPATLVEKQSYYVSYVTYQDNQRFAYFSPSLDERVLGVDDAFDTIVTKKDENQNDIGGLDTLDDKTAIITLSAFEGDAGYQMGAIIKYMREKGKESLILNLCGNGGGDMAILTEIASYLIFNNENNNYKIVVANEKLDGDGSQTEDNYRVSNFSVKTNNFDVGIKRITVMADRNTASASECLIGAMIDYASSSNNTFSKNNIVITGSQENGQTVYRTYGKGIMQTTYRLQSGGALKLTTAKITWPVSEKCIHKVGITPSLPENGCDDFDKTLNRAIQIASLNN